MPEEMMKDETSTNLDVDEIELVLRRFASQKNDQQLSKLLDSMFVETAEQKIKHENSMGDSTEDMKEGD